MPGLKIVLETDAAERGARALKKSLETLGASAASNEKEFKRLRDRMEEGLQADKAKAAIDNLQRSLNLTRLETAKFYRSIGDNGSAIKTMIAGVGDLSSTMGTLTGVLTGPAGVAIALGVVTAKFSSFTAEAIKSASDLQEVASKYSVVFKGQTDTVDAWVQNIVDKYAMSTREAKQYLSSIQDLLVPMGMQAKAAANLSNEMVKLAADLGSFNNLPTQQVIENIQSALVGEYETMKKYGVVLNAATVEQEALNMRLADTKNALTAADKAQAAYQLITKSSTAAIGDMERTSDEYANTTKSLSAEWEDFTSTLGTKFLPMATKVKRALADMLDGATKFLSSQSVAVDTQIEALKAKISSVEKIKSQMEESNNSASKYQGIVLDVLKSDLAELEEIRKSSQLKTFWNDFNDGLDNAQKETDKFVEDQKNAWIKYEQDIKGIEARTLSARIKSAEAALASYLKNENAKPEIVSAAQAEISALYEQSSKKEATAHKKVTSAYKKELEDQKRAVAEFNEEYKKATLSTFDYEIDKLDEWYDEQLEIVEKGLISRQDLEETYAEKWFEIYEEDVSEFVDAENEKIEAKKKANDELIEELEKLEKEQEEALEKQQEAYDELYEKVYGITRDVIDDWESMGDTLVDLAKETIKDIAAAFLSKTIVIPVYMYASESLGLSSFISGGTESSSGTSSGLSISGLSDATSLYKATTGGMSTSVSNFLSSDTISSLGTSVFGDAWGGATTGAEYLLTSADGTMVSVSSGSSGSSGIVGAVSDAVPAGIISSLAYTYLGDMLGLPQSDYSGITSGLGGAAGYSIGASIGSGFPVVGTVIGALAGGLLGSLFGEDEPDYRLGIVKGNDMSNFQGSNRVAASDSGYQYRLVTQDYDVKDSSAFIDFFDSVFSALDDVTTADINDILLNSQAGDYGRISWFDPSGGDTDASLTQMSNDLFKALQKGLVEDIGAGFDASVFDYDFFDSIKADEEALLDTYLGFRETVEALGSGEFLEQFTYQMEEFGLSAESAYTKVKTISDTVTSISDAVDTLSDATTLSALNETTDAWDVLIDALESSRATTEQLTKAETARNEVLGANVTGLTASTIESQITSGGDLSGLVSTQKTTIAASYIAETIYDQYVAGINEEAGRLFAESDYDVNVLIEYLNNLDTSEAQASITELQESLGLLSDAAEESTSAALAKQRELEIDILYAQGDAETALAMEREDIINDLIETYGTESDTIIDLQRQLWALNDATEETTEVLEDLLSLVEDARDDYYDELEDALDTAEEEYDDLVDAFADAEDQLNEVRAAHIEQQKTLLQEQTDAYSDAIKDLTSELSNLENIAEDLAEYREGLLLSDDSPLLPGEMLAAAKAKFAAAGPEGLVEASQDLLSAGRGALTDYKEYGALFSMVQSRVSGAESTVKTQSQALQEQIDMASVQVDLLNEEISLMTETSETLMSIEDAEAEYYAAKLELDNSSLAEDIAFYEEELDRLDEINGSVLSLDQATRNYQSALISAISQGYRNLEYNFQSELNELKDSLGIGASFADGGIISGPSSGYNVMTQFHGTEMIIPESKFNSLESGIDSDLKSLIKALIAKVSEDSKYNKKIHRILDRVDSGQGSLLVRTE